MKEETAFQAIVWAKLGGKADFDFFAGRRVLLGLGEGGRDRGGRSRGRKPRNGEKSVGEIMKTLPTIPHLSDPFDCRRRRSI